MALSLTKSLIPGGDYIAYEPEAQVRQNISESQIKQSVGEIQVRRSVGEIMATSSTRDGFNTALRQDHPELYLQNYVDISTFTADNFKY